jgi:hypothetical protein
VKPKKIPYGLSDYKLIKSENYYFVDKTKYIEKLEDANERYIMFLRPRRFGKSLFIAMLEGYYDTYYKKDFDLMFSDTYIGSNLTPKASSYLVMRFDFSGIDINDVENDFKYYLNIILTSFIEKYNLDIQINSDNPISLFKDIFKYLDKHKLELYLLIDEYDNFANKLLLQNKDRYFDVIADKTAMFKQFFTTLKTATSGNDSPLKRMFITGVTPMTMYDVTSGFNIGANISIDKEFNSMVGLTQDEVDTMLEYYNVDIDKKILKEWYNNYIFNEDSTAIYNSDMILNFIKEYLKENKIPKEMIDINVRSDYSKLRHIIYTNGKLNGNFDILRDLIAGESISLDSLVQDFSALNLEKEINFKSLLFYLGLTTIKNREFKLNFIIPNETVKRIDMEFLDRSLEFEEVFKLNINKYQKLLENFALNGNIEVFEFLADEIDRNSGIRDYIYKEQHIKAMYLSYFSIVSYFIAKSEKELNKGFADIFIKPFNNPYVKYFGLIEFKYINRDEKATKQKIDKLTQEAKEQLEVYAKDDLVKEYLDQGVKLKKIIMVFHGWELVKIEEF